MAGNEYVRVGMQRDGLLSRTVGDAHELTTWAHGLQAIVPSTAVPVRAPGVTSLTRSGAR